MEELLFPVELTFQIPSLDITALVRTHGGIVIDTANKLFRPIVTQIEIVFQPVW